MLQKGGTAYVGSAAWGVQLTGPQWLTGEGGRTPAAAKDTFLHNRLGWLRGQKTT